MALDPFPNLFMIRCYFVLHKIIVTKIASPAKIRLMRKKIVVIGGGTGTYTTLMGLRKYPHELSVIVSMMDSGGSNRIIRDEFGLLPTSDLRQVLVALAGEHSSDIFRKLFSYRYNNGTGIAGMTFGNLFMAALTDIYSSQKKALEETAKLLEVKGKIIPVTWDNTNLVARYANGRQVLGEHYIDEPDGALGEQKIVELEVFPPAKLNPDAITAIKAADLIVFAPGDLYTSLICNLVVDGLAKQIKRSKAKKVMVMNLMTKFGQTNGFTAQDHLDQLEAYLGGNIIDAILINNNLDFRKNILEKYQEERSGLVEDDLTTKTIIRTDLLSDIIYQKPKSDPLFRSLIRHDPDKLAKAICKLL